MPVMSTPRRVLLAEDNRDLLEIFARKLNLLGLEVLGVANGRDAAEIALAALAAGNPFDLVLMDLEMPIVDGYEATRQLRAGGFSGPIVALTAHSTDDNRMDCLAMGCDDCLCKPVDLDHLGGLIRRYIPDLRPVRRDIGRDG
jgi:CheY-like chemotaxis protein